MMDVTPQKLKEELDKGTAMAIIDLQPTDQYEHSHVPGAVNIPYEQFGQLYPAVLKDKNLPIVLYGEFDALQKGTQAGQVLEQAGYTRVGHIVGGVHGWKEAGYPTEGGMES